MTKKVNVFAQFPNGKSMYKSEYYTEKTTINDIVARCKLSTHGISIYLNGNKLPESEWSKTIESFKLKGFTLITLRFGEMLEHHSELSKL